MVDTTPKKKGILSLTDSTSAWNKTPEHDMFFFIEPNVTFVVWIVGDEFG